MQRKALFSHTESLQGWESQLAAAGTFSRSILLFCTATESSIKIAISGCLRRGWHCENEISLGKEAQYRRRISMDFLLQCDFQPWVQPANAKGKRPLIGVAAVTESINRSVLEVVCGGARNGCGFRRVEGHFQTLCRRSYYLWVISPIDILTIG